MASLQTARKAKAKASLMLAEHPRVQGIGLTKRNGEFAIKVNLLEADADDEFPSDVDGVPLKVEVVGRIRRRLSAS